MTNPQKKSVPGGTMIAGGASGHAQPGSVPPDSGSVPPTEASPPPVEPPATDPLVGTVLAERYRVLKKLGEGGMGSVYLAEHTTINKKLAIKVLSSEFSHKQDLVDRFLQEARAASMIDQENVVEITDFGSTPTGSVFFVMEFLLGEDLAATVKHEGSLPWARVKPIILQICEALSAAHEAGIIHRDMKPENCYRIKRGSREDFIKVLDFGIAKVQSDEGDGGRGLTRTGMIFGTPEYMSPEQAKGEKVDARVDVYAVGVILYELLTGRVPFTADTFMGILTKHMFEAPPAPATVAPHADIPPEVEAIILKALQKDREYRFQSMHDMKRAIEAVGTGSAAVSVVSEQVAMPTTGETRFSTGSRAITLDGLDERPRSSRTGLFLGLGLGALVLLGGAGAMALGVFEPEPPPEPAPAVIAQADESEPEPPVDPEPPVEESAGEGEGDDSSAPTLSPMVSITVSTPGIEGYVIDGRDDGRLGKTNEAIELPRGSESIDLYVRAEGYEAALVPVVPNGDKTLTASLAKLEEDEGAKSRSRSKRRGKRRRSKDRKPKPAPVAEPKKPPEPAKPTPTPKPKQPRPSTSSPDLKDPFRTGG